MWPAGLLHTVFGALMTAIIGYMVVISLLYFLMMVLGFFALQHYHGRLLRTEREALFKSPLVPRVSVLAPAFNEAETILNSVRALLTLRYPNYEVVVINDGSDDETLPRLIAAFHLYRSNRAALGTLTTEPIRAIYQSRDAIPLVVVDKVNGGKADALNAGLNVARGDLVCAVDADTLIESDALLRMARPFLD
ncbi:MAG: glycosyltransferase family 2 protein, partial [Gemmatimonadota bacterium]